MTAKPRRTDFDKVEKEAESSSGISQFDLITAIQGKLTGDPSEDLSSIYEKFRRDSTEVFLVLAYLIIFSSLMVLSISFRCTFRNILISLFK